MPKVDWDLPRGSISNFDRSKVFKPYAGPMPPNAVYQWRVGKVTYAAGTGDAHPQLRAGLELKPRNKDEKRFGGYFIMMFMNVAPDLEFTYVPFLDAIGVSENEFRNGTLTDKEGTVTKIGRWKSDGKTLILGQLTDNNYVNSKGEEKSGKQIRWVGALDSEPEEEYEEDEYEDDEEVDEDEDDGF